MASKPKWQQEAEEAAVPLISEVEGFREFKSDPDPTIEGNPVQTVEQLVVRKKVLDAVKKEAEERLKWIGEQLMLAMASAGVERAKTPEGWTLKVGYGASPSKIEPTLLLQAGVTVEQIQKATVTGKPYSFVQVVVPKPKTTPGGGE